MVRRLALFLAFSIIGVSPAAYLVYTAARPDPLGELRVDARALAAILDQRSRGWRLDAARMAEELSALLSQLKGQTIGPAAEGTLMLHLQNRLKQHPDVGEFALLDARSNVSLSTDGTRVLGKQNAGMPEIASAAARPALLLVRSGSGQGELVAAAPLLLKKKLRWVFVLRIKSAVIRALLRSPNGRDARLFDGQGLSLGAPFAKEAMLRIGSASEAGAIRIAGTLVAFVPLSSARVTVVIAADPGPEPSPWQSKHLLVLAAIIVASLGAALAFGARR